MNLLKICHGFLSEGVLEFITFVARIMSWASIDFVNDVADQLALIERAGRA
jgi:hypothetical protein